MALGHKVELMRLSCAAMANAILAQGSADQPEMRKKACQRMWDSQEAWSSRNDKPYIYEDRKGNFACDV